MSDCDKELARLKKVFVQLLVAQGNSNLLIAQRNSILVNSQGNSNQNKTNHKQLLEQGFKSSVIKRVLSKMKRSGRPYTNYSKRSGLLKTSSIVKKRSAVITN
jgi:hypothetical protein